MGSLLRNAQTGTELVLQMKVSDFVKIYDTVCKIHLEKKMKESKIHVDEVNRSFRKQSASKP